MSEALESLEDLATDLDELIQEEKEGTGNSGSNSIRDLSNTTDKGANLAENGVKTTRLEMLQAWKMLVQCLYEGRIYLQYAPLLEKLFFSCNVLKDYRTIKLMVESMVETADNRDKPDADCRYITLFEILSSFANHWEMSYSCETMWQSKDLPIPNIHKTTSLEFRKLAYQVLMGLEWVPSFPELRSLCGFAEDESMDPQVPEVVKDWFLQIRSVPLPRRDNIHRLLYRLREASNAVTLAISSQRQGMGKTTLAAMLTSHPILQSKYSVLWLRLNKLNSLTYSTYVEYLKLLCEQLQETPKWPQNVQILEEDALQEKRRDEKMFQVKRDVAQVLEGATHKPLLLVIDDVKNDQDVEWFRFTSNQSMVVTTTCQNLTVDWNLELEPLSEEEALELFLTEADYSPSHVLRKSMEAKSIVYRCAYHPLTIRTVARWFRLKQVTAGVVKGLEELHQEISSCTSKLRHASNKKHVSTIKLLFETMNLMLSPTLAGGNGGGQPTTLMKLCLHSMVAIFPASVPVAVLHLLWGRLLETEPEAIRELGDNLRPAQIRKRVRFITEALSSLGLLTITDETIPHAKLHHRLQTEYAAMIDRETKFREKKHWHAAFADAYLEAVKEGDISEELSRAYALKELIRHILKAKQMQRAAVFLKSEEFLERRIKNMGYEKSAENHIEDINKLQSSMARDESIAADPLEVAVSILVKVGCHIANHKDIGNNTSKAEDASRGVYLIGFALGKRARYSEAVSQYKTGLKLLTNPESVHAGTILFTLSATHLARKDNDKALRNLKECLHVMNQNGESNVFYSEALMLKGDALRIDCDYKAAMEYYDFALEKLQSHAANNRVEIGCCLGRKGRLHFIMGDMKNARKVLEDCREWKLKMYEESLDLASVYNYLGDIYLLDEEKKAALDCFEKAARIYSGCREVRCEADINIVKGKAEGIRGETKKCLEHFEIAIKKMKKQNRFASDQISVDLRAIGCMYSYVKAYPKALDAFNRCLRQTEDKSEESLERSAALYEMGELYLDQKETKMALDCLQKSLRIREAVLGETQGVIETLQKIGKVHRSVQKYDEALPYLNQALDMCEKVYGEKTEQVATVLYFLASIKEEMNETVEAVAMFEECLDLRRRIFFAKPHPAVADTLEGLGKLHLKQGEVDNAFQCYVESLDIRQGSMKAADPAIANTLHHLGIIARKGGDLERALAFLLEALEIRKTFEVQDDTVITLTEIGHIHRHLGDIASAMGCYDTGLEILLSTYGENDVRLADICIPCGHIQKDIGSNAEAIQCYEQALRIRKNAFGGKDVRTGAVYRSLGLIHFDMANYDEALENLNQFIHIQESNKVKKGVDMILAWQLTGDIYRHQMKTDDATSCFSAAFNAFSHNRDVSARYPQFGPLLESRLAANNNENDDPSFGDPTNGLLARISGELGRLVHEVRIGDVGPIEYTKQEKELRAAIVFDD